MSKPINLGAIVYNFLSTQNKIAAQIYRQSPEKEKTAPGAATPKGGKQNNTI